MLPFNEGIETILGYCMFSVFITATLVLLVSCCSCQCHDVHLVRNYAADLSKIRKVLSKTITPIKKAHIELNY